MNILFTSVGRRSYLIKYFKKALMEYGGEIHVINSSAISPVFQLADKATVSPLIYDKEYIPFLLEYSEKNKIDAIISLLDIDLPKLAENKERFAHIGTKVIVSDKNVIDICNDKWRTYKFLSDNGFNAPMTFLSPDLARNAIEIGSINYPVIVKPRWGMGSIGLYTADNDEELCVFYKKIKRELFLTDLKYESANDVENCVLIQEKLDGQEYGMDVINDLDGDYRNAVVKKKYAMRSGETDCAMTVENSEIKRVGRSLAGLLKHIGNLDADVFVSDGKTYVLELNARFGGGYPFSHMAGVDLPLAIVKWLHGEDVDRSVLTERFNILAQKDIDIVQLESVSISEDKIKGKRGMKGIWKNKEARGGG